MPKTAEEEELERLQKETLEKELQRKQIADNLGIQNIGTQEIFDALAGTSTNLPKITPTKTSELTEKEKQERVKKAVETAKQTGELKLREESAKSKKSLIAPAKLILTDRETEDVAREVAEEIQNIIDKEAEPEVEPEVAKETEKEAEPE